MRKWKLMICDDDDTIHQLSEYMLKRIHFMDRGAEVLHAYSSDECLSLLREHPDTALLLLDMVMEDDDSGVSTLMKIRGELNNSQVRVILRSGNTDPDLDKSLFEKYDLTDYREKTQLTSRSTDRMIYSALRSYYNMTELAGGKGAAERGSA